MAYQSPYSMPISILRQAAKLSLTGSQPLVAVEKSDREQLQKKAHAALKQAIKLDDRFGRYHYGERYNLSLKIDLPKFETTYCYIYFDEGNQCGLFYNNRIVGLISDFQELIVFEKAVRDLYPQALEQKQKEAVGKKIKK